MVCVSLGRGGGRVNGLLCQPRKGEQGEWSVVSLGRGSRVNGLCLV